MSSGTDLDTGTLGSASAGPSFSSVVGTLASGMVANSGLPVVAPVVGAATGAGAAGGITSKLIGGLGANIPNYALIAVGIVMGLGALLISQKSATTNIIEATTGAVKKVGALAA